VKSGRKPVEECLEEEKERKRVEALARYWWLLLLLLVLFVWSLRTQLLSPPVVELIDDISNPALFQNWNKEFDFKRKPLGELSTWNFVTVVNTLLDVMNGVSPQEAKMFDVCVYTLVNFVI
jgi:hypothetical protein